MRLPKKLFLAFTLIELLVVIAILGILAAAVLVAINPGERMAQSRDSARKSTVGQLVRAVQTYNIETGTYFSAGNNWLNNLVDSKEIKIPPPIISYSKTVSCGENLLPTIIRSPGIVQNGYCYVNFGTWVKLYASLESSSDKKQCEVKTLVTNSYPFFYWTSYENKLGVVCQKSGGDACDATNACIWEDNGAYPLPN